MKIIFGSLSFLCYYSNDFVKAYSKFFELSADAYSVFGVLGVSIS